MRHRCPDPLARLSCWLWHFVSWATSGPPLWRATPLPLWWGQLARHQTKCSGPLRRESPTKTRTLSPTRSCRASLHCSKHPPSQSASNSSSITSASSKATQSAAKRRISLTRNTYHIHIYHISLLYEKQCVRYVQFDVCFDIALN